MANPPSTPKPADEGTIPPSAFAGFLSYLVPGLGQLYQGRIAKGLLFLVALYGLFFFGMYLGDWRCVHLPNTAKNNNPWGLPTLLANLYNRPQFAGQVWIGVAAWPALLQYNNMPVPVWKDFEKTPPETELNELQTRGDKTWDLAWVYTVIAGVLNILVIYDAAAGPAFTGENAAKKKEAQGQHAIPATAIRI